MPHHINTRKKRQYEKRLLQGGGSVTQGYIAEIAIPVKQNGDQYIQRMKEEHFQRISGVTEHLRFGMEYGAKIISKVIDRPNYESAMRRASEYGTVLSCHKIEEEFFIKRIEHLVLPKPQPVMEVMDFEVKVDKNLVAEKQTAKKTFTIEIEK
jgi:hypothetical protein